MPGLSRWTRFQDHIIRLRRQLGDRLELGDRRFLVRGYISNLLTVDSVYEPELDVVLTRILQRPGHVIDVGANLGQTLGKVLRIDPERSYLGFEPQVMACAMVASFLRDNGLHQAQILPLGLSDRNGIEQLWGEGNADTMASIASPVDASSRRGARTSVPVRVGDEVLEELGIDEIAAVKVDVEGFELPVLKGLSRTLDRVKPPLIFEVLPNFEGEQRTLVPAAVAEERRANASAIQALLEGMGYALYQLRDDGTEVAIRTFDLDTPAAYAGSNYLARVAELRDDAQLAQPADPCSEASPP